MNAYQNYGAHSAHVEMTLIVNGESLSVTHMGPDFLIIEPSSDYPPGEAAIVLQVDDSERRWTLRLLNGIQAGQERVLLAKP